VKLNLNCDSDFGLVKGQVTDKQMHMKLNLTCNGEFGLGHGQVTYRQIHVKLNLICDGDFGLGQGQVREGGSVVGLGDGVRAALVQSSRAQEGHDHTGHQLFQVQLFFGQERGVV